MDRLQLRYKFVKKALDRLEEAIERLTAIANPSTEDYRFVRDSAIKRFELCADVLWKYVKLYLLVRKGLLKQRPKMCFAHV